MLPSLFTHIAFWKKTNLEYFYKNAVFTQDFLTESLKAEDPAGSVLSVTFAIRGWRAPHQGQEPAAPSSSSGPG